MKSTGYSEELLQDVQAVLEKHGTADVLYLLANGAEMLSGLAQSVKDEREIVKASKALFEAWRLMVQAEKLVAGHGTLAGSIEVIRDCQAEEGLSPERVTE